MFRCCDNIAPNAKCLQVLPIIALCLVVLASVKFYHTHLPHSDSNVGYAYFCLHKEESGSGFRSFLHSFFLFTRLLQKSWMKLHESLEMIAFVQRIFDYILGGLVRIGGFDPLSDFCQTARADMYRVLCRTAGTIVGCWLGIEYHRRGWRRTVGLGRIRRTVGLYCMPDRRIDGGLLSGHDVVSKPCLV